MYDTHIKYTVSDFYCPFLRVFKVDITAILWVEGMCQHTPRPVEIDAVTVRALYERDHQYGVTTDPGEGQRGVLRPDVKS